MVSKAARNCNGLNPASWKNLHERLTSLGSTIEPGGKHWKVTLPNGRRTSMACSASDTRALLNMCSDLRKQGVDVRRMTVDA